MTKNNYKLVIKIAAALVIALISVFVLTRYAASPEFHAKTIQSLDEKKKTVMELTAASVAASTAVTMIPGETATPIAEKLADLSSYFLIVLCAIYLEKYLLTITGFAAFQILIPAACLLYVIGLFRKKEIYRQFVVKLTVFAIAIAAVIPAGVKVADMIEATYESSINSTLASAKEATEEIEENTEESGGVWDKFVGAIKDGVSGIVTKVETVLNNFIESLAVMIVTSCLIPILVLLFFVWFTKLILGIQIPLPKKLPAVGTRKRNSNKSESL